MSTPVSWNTPLIDLPGVGRERSAQLERLGMRTAGDLLLHRPRRHEDRRHIMPIAEVKVGEPTTVRGRVKAVGLKRMRQRGRSLVELIVEDDSARLHCRWWNMPYMQDYFHVGDDLFLYGKLSGLKPRTMDHPETEVLDDTGEASIHLNRLTPVYPLTEGLPQRWLRTLVWNTLDWVIPGLEAPWPKLDLGEYVARGEALRQLHFPDTRQALDAARQRLALDELLAFQMTLRDRRRKLFDRSPGLVCPGSNKLIRLFLAALAYSLTNDQRKVLREIRADLQRGHPMRRLLQGDVGSGKTVVAACCALMVLEAGAHVALMAPTDLLAQQHFQTFQKWFRPLGVDVALHTGQRKTRSSTESPVRPTVVIGTHALAHAGFELPNLGLVLIDEQHKFGVCQREDLVRKGACPHLLVMTATPIPRTLGLTLYGDLDLSIIAQLPAGRHPLKTYVRPADTLPKVIEFIRGKLAAGHQAYVVYPRVDSSGKPGAVKSVTREFEAWKEQLAPHAVGLLHGRLGGAAKEAVMQDFREGRIQVLVSTTVIEVGLDVPRANLMVIEQAELFGLAQLHQLRGRIGRGSQQAWCILISEAATPEAKQRLQVMASTADGFVIAEEDLRLRGPGEFLGAQQSGLPPFIFADLIGDRGLIEAARRLAGLAAS